jgi:serine/threonine protein kinase
MIAPGDVIDDTYRVESLIGEGSYGSVYRCHDARLGRTVAVKVLNANKTGDRDVKRFMAEGRHLAALHHPNVVLVYHLGFHDGSPYMAMEHLKGRTFRQLAHGERLPLRGTLAAMRQVAAGLGAVHASGIVHHDLSLGNLMLTTGGQAKLLDFGLSRDTHHLSSMSSEGHLVGTMMFLAPEQIEGRGTTLRSEIFSFGVILYEMLTGRNPFQAEHVTSVLFNIANRDPEPLGRLIQQCPPALDGLARACLAKRPEDRPRDMEDVQRRIDAVLADADLDAASTTGPAEGAPRHTPTPTSSRNPYLNRVMIKSRDGFFGRRQEVQRIFARLNATPPGSISIVGDRKIGKSSLLNHVYMNAQRQRLLEEPEKTVMVFVDLQEHKSMSIAAFVQVLLSIASYELRGRLEVADCSHDLEGVKTLVQRLDSAGFRLAILLDEFDAVTTNPSFDLEFFSFLRFLANHYNVAYLTSSARNLQVLCHTKEISDSPFFNIFSTMRLSAFPPDEAEELIRVPSERAGKPLAAHTERVLDMAGRFPFFIQMACAHAIEYLEENPGRPPDFTEIRRRFCEEARHHYRYVWDSFDAYEQSAVERVAKRKGIPDGLRHVVAELSARHYVETDGRAPRLFASTFDEFVRLEAARGSSDKPSLLGRLFGRGASARARG